MKQVTPPAAGIKEACPSGVERVYMAMRPCLRGEQVRSVGSLCAARRSAPDWPTATEPIRPQAAM